MIEAIACGTPVAAYGRGAVPEVLQGLPMFICNDFQHMEQLVSGDCPVKPSVLRKYVTEQYTKEKMTDKYLELYKRAINGWN